MRSVSLNDWTAEYYIENRLSCNSLLENADVVKEISSLNTSALHDLRDGQLVRFRGMIQDMYDPEYYFESYEIKNSETGEFSTRCGLYRDAAKCLDHESIDLNSDKNTSADRQTYVVISTPGLNEWAKDTEKQLRPASATHSVVKRSHEDGESMDTSEPVKKKDRPDKELAGCSSEAPKFTVSRDHILNFPIPIIDGKACLVKIYEESTLRLNQVVDIIGFISLDPMISLHTSEEMNDAEAQTHNPPASLVPRLHAIKIAESKCYGIPDPLPIVSRAQAIRSDLHMVLSQLLFGDNLAADYLICHLISSVYTRKDCLCLGNFPLNITNFPIEQHKSFPRDFYDVLSGLVTKSHYFECTLENLNDLSLVPKKDYECNRLTSGILQLSNNTHLIIDETKLTIGQLTASGRLNYNAIGDLVKFQKLTYDFKFYTIEYETDIPVLILSDVKSFIPCSLQVPLKIDSESEQLYPQIIEASRQYLKDEGRLNDFRQYLELMRTADFQLGEDITDVIQEDFVKLRKSDQSVNADNLHSLMVFARLMALSHGRNSLTVDCWKRSFEMENDRVSRLARRKT